MKRDIRALTGVRGVAAVLILLYHFGNVQLFDGGSLSYIPIPLGYLAVELFFMLSGYVIALTYGEKLSGGYQGKTFSEFMIKRVARIYPAYLVIASLYVLKIVVGLSGDDTLAMFSTWDKIGNVLMLTGWGLHIQPLVGVAWAASAEMGSYLLAPVLIVWTLHRRPPVSILVLVASIIAVGLVAISGRGANGPLDVVNGDSFYPLGRAVAGFAIGMVLYRFSDQLMKPISAAAQDILVVVLVAAIAATMAWLQNDLVLYALLIPFVLVLSRDGRMAQLLFGNALVYRLGIISYSIYLLHPLFVSLAVRVWRAYGQTEAVYLAAVAGFTLLILALSELSYRLVEMPARDAIASWLKRRRSDSQARGRPV